MEELVDLLTRRVPRGSDEKKPNGGERSVP
jgi:hypothetical protein